MDDVLEKDVDYITHAFFAYKEANADELRNLRESIQRQQRAIDEINAQMSAVHHLADESHGHFVSLMAIAKDDTIKPRKNMQEQRIVNVEASCASTRNEASRLWDVKANKGDIKEIIEDLKREINSKADELVIDAIRDELGHDLEYRDERITELSIDLERLQKEVHILSDEMHEIRGAIIEIRALAQESHEHFVALMAIAKDEVTSAERQWQQRVDDLRNL